LPSIKDGSVDCIVTDPPWGEHEQVDVEYDEFAAEMPHSFDRILDPASGRLVLLVARKLLATVADQWPHHHLQIKRFYDILINGHPATVLAGGR
jgi:tRNA G10  N-methylase Trm11